MPCRAHTRQVAVAAAALEVSGHGGSPHATACRALSLACALAEAAQGGVWVQDECGWYQIPYREAVAAAVPPAGIAGRTATERNLGTGDGALWSGGTAADPSLDARGKARRTVAAETNPMMGGVGCTDGLFGPGEQWIEPSPALFTPGPLPPGLMAHLDLGNLTAVEATAAAVSTLASGALLCLPLVVPASKGGAVDPADALLRDGESIVRSRIVKRRSMSARAGVIGLMVLGGRTEQGFGTASSCGFTPQDVQRLQPFCEAAAVAVRDSLLSRALGRSRERRESLQAALCALAPVALAGDGMLHRAVAAPMPVTVAERLAAISRCASTLRGSPLPC